MKTLYNIGILTYVFLVRIAALFNPKAKLWITGRKDLFRKMQKAIPFGTPIAWFHVSSLGEFEQGRPVMEAFREIHPEYKILLTFFPHRDMK